MAIWEHRRAEIAIATRFEARVARHDREVAVIRKLILQGMKMINALTVAQRKTDAQLKAFVQSMTRGSNGHAKPQ